MTEKQRDENYVKKQIKAFLDNIHAYSFPVPANGMGVSGIPDRIAVLDDGLFLAIEAKRPGRRGEANRGCSALQVKSLRAIADKGGFAWVVDGEEDLGRLLDALSTFEVDRNPSFGPRCNLDLDYWKKK